MSTIILGLIIFGLAAYIVYSQLFLKKGNQCGDNCHCASKPKKNKSTL